MHEIAKEEVIVLLEKNIVLISLYFFLFKVLESFEKIKTKIKDMRNSSLKKSGENSVENLIFKELRNLGYLDKMNEYIKSRQDESLSLK